MRFAAATDIGRARSNNEDSYIACAVSDDLFLGAVADGMGGGEAGGEASRLALSSFKETVALSLQEGMNWRKAMSKAVTTANQQILKRSMNEFGYPGMGTTLTAVLMGPGVLHLCHVGDSRAYIIDNGVIRQISRDHSLVGEMIRKGDITEDEAMVHPKRNVLTRALGVQPKVDVDIKEVRLDSGNLVVLCTDGLSGLVSSEELNEVVSSARDLQKAVSTLVEIANGRGGYDNITVLLLEPGGEG